MGSLEYRSVPWLDGNRSAFKGASVSGIQLVSHKMDQTLRFTLNFGRKSKGFQRGVGFWTSGALCCFPCSLSMFILNFELQLIVFSFLMFNFAAKNTAAKFVSFFDLQFCDKGTEQHRCEVCIIFRFSILRPKDDLYR